MNQKHLFSFPKVVASSVIRSAHKGDSHGGVYIVNLDTEEYKQVVDWNDQAISWEGRGADRGLRGIAFYNDHIYLAASDEVFVYDSDFNMIESYQNRYLKHCHEIFIANHTLFLTSTGFDSVLEFDLQSRSFSRGYLLRFGQMRRLSTGMRLMLKLRLKPSLAIFDPNLDDGPLPSDTLHINNVYYSDDTLYFSGAHLGNVFCIRDGIMSRYARVPFGTHNAHPFRQGVLLNDTSAGQAAYLSRRGQILRSFSIKHYQEEALLMSHLPRDHARQGFGRGLCVTDNDLIIGGSSPATISVYELDKGPEAIKSVNITLDVRNAIHGLEIWPY